MSFGFAFCFNCTKPRRCQTSRHQQGPKEPVYLLLSWRGPRDGSVDCKAQSISIDTFTAPLPLNVRSTAPRNPDFWDLCLHYCPASGHYFRCPEVILTSATLDSHHYPAVMQLLLPVFTLLLTLLPLVLLCIPVTWVLDASWHSVGQ